MFPILPSSILQMQASREQYAPDNEEANAQKHGRVVHSSGSKGTEPSANATVQEGGEVGHSGANPRTVAHSLGKIFHPAHKPATKPTF